MVTTRLSQTRGLGLADGCGGWPSEPAIALVFRASSQAWQVAKSRQPQDFKCGWDWLALRGLAKWPPLPVVGFPGQPSAAAERRLSGC